MDPIPQSELDDFLRQMQQAGQTDSGGRFSIDLRKALDKMGRFGLPRSSYALRHLANAAVLTGASEIEISLSARKSTVVFDGGGFSIDELKDLFSALLLVRRLGLRELATALNTARQSARVQLSTPTASLHLRGDEFSVESAENAPSQTRIDFSGNLLMALIQGRKERLATLSEWCCYAPIPLRVDGKKINTAFEVGHCLAVALLGSVEGNLPKFRAAPSLVRSELPESRLTGYLCLHSELEDWTAFLVGATHYWWEAPGLPYSGVVALLRNDALELNLSASRPTENPALEEVHQELVGNIDQLVLQVLQHPERDQTPEIGELGRAYLRRILDTDSGQMLEPRAADISFDAIEGSITLAALVETQLSQGYVLASDNGSYPNHLDPTSVLHYTPTVERMLSEVLHLIPVAHLGTEPPTLPSGNYLVRVPARSFVGELGLEAGGNEALLYVHNLFDGSYSVQRIEGLAPDGVRLCAATTSEELDPDQVRQDLETLYHTLLKRRDRDETLPFQLAYLNFIFAQSDNFAWTSLLVSIASRVKIDTAGGTPVTLLELMDGIPRPYRGVADGFRRAPGVPPETVMLTGHNAFLLPVLNKLFREHPNQSACTPLAKSVILAPRQGDQRLETTMVLERLLDTIVIAGMLKREETEALRIQLQQIAEPEEGTGWLSVQVEETLELAGVEAQKLGGILSVETLLLGLAQAEGGRASPLLAQAGLSVEVLKRRIAAADRLDILEQLSRQVEASANVLDLYARAHTNLVLGRIEAAAADARAGLDLDPESGPLRVLLAIVRGLQDDFERAEELLRLTIADTPDWSDPRISLGYLLVFRGALEAAEAQCQQALRLKPSVRLRAHAWSILALIALERQESATAAGLARRSLHLEPEVPWSTESLARALEMQGEAAEAAAEYEAFLRLAEQGWPPVEWKLAERAARARRALTRLRNEI